MALELKRNYLEDLRLFDGPGPRNAAILLLVALSASGLFIASSYSVYVMTTVAVLTIAALGLNLLVGYTGLISLGHAAFLAIGAYTHVIVYTLGAPFPVGIGAAALAASACGVIVGIPALRLKGPYLAIATLGFQVTVDQVLGRWDSLTGGRMGLGVPHPAEVASIASFVGIHRERVYFVVCLGVAAASAIAVYNVARSRVGRALVAIRDNETAAEAMGVGLVKYKTLAFALSAALTGVAGGLYAHLFDRINPSNFSLILSIEMLVMILVGGLGSVLGSILGATLLVALQTLLSDFQKYQSIIIGSILVGVLLFEPMGLRGRWLRIKYYFKAWPF